jgi:uncharacterized protein (DUF2236 family)
VMKNPVALMIGGIAGVIMELAEPRVRTGVWEHTRFRQDPAGRVQRTGYAALATVYAPAEAARALIARVNAMHARISGETLAGLAYRSDDPELLTWVHATAGFGFLEAYHRFVRPLSLAERDQFYAEGAPVAALWGAPDAPISATEVESLFQRMRPKLERSDIVFEFLAIMKRAPLLPALARPIQRAAVRAAVDITPSWARDILGLSSRFNLPFGGVMFLRTLGAAAERIAIDAPPAQASARMGLPADYLYR